MNIPGNENGIAMDQSDSDTVDDFYEERSDFFYDIVKDGIDDYQYSFFSDIIDKFDASLKLELSDFSKENDYDFSIRKSLVNVYSERAADYNEDEFRENRSSISSDIDAVKCMFER
jgi:hypothetical protein